jgi:hypothetical protein
LDPIEKGAEKGAECGVALNETVIANGCQSEPEALAVEHWNLHLRAGLVET